MNEGGTIEGWTAPDSWLCSGYQLGSLKEGKYTKDEMYEALLAEADDTTMLFRFLGFLLLWFAFCNAMHDIAAPFFMIAEFVPLIGQYVGDSLGTVICVVSWFPSAGCSIMVIGICWVLFRPSVGIPMMLLSGCAAASFGYWKKKKEDEKAQKEDQEPSPEDAQAQDSKDQEPSSPTASTVSPTSTASTPEAAISLPAKAQVSKDPEPSPEDAKRWASNPEEP